MEIMMKYYELKLDDTNFIEAPDLIDWYGIQDVRLIKWETFHKLKNRLVYRIKPAGNIIFTDIISFPFLLVSPMVRAVIEMYGDKVVFKEVILISAEKEVEEVYYLPIMEESNQINMLYVKKEQNYIKQTKIPEWVGERNIFWVKKNEKRHTIVNLDLAESLLRRNAVGLELKEVFLSQI